MKDLRFYITVFIVHLVERLKRNDPVFLENRPGQKALRLYPNILKYLSEDVESIVITGTNGKTTTTKFIANILRKNGNDLFTNSEGANLIWRITTLYLNNYSILKGPKKKLAVLECDEGNLERVIPVINPKILIITNVFPDQVSRFKSESNVFSMIYKSMEKTKPSICIINNNCHFYHQFKTIPNWTFIDYDSKLNYIEVYGEKRELNLNTPGQFNIANANAAVKTCEILGVSKEKILEGLIETKPSFGRFETFNIDGKEIKIVLVKNNEGYKVVSDYIIKSFLSNKNALKEYENIVIAMNTGVGDDENIEWLNLNSYQELTKYFKKVYISGDCKNTLANIFNSQDIFPIEVDMPNLLNIIKLESKNTLVLCNYTAMLDVRQIFINIGVLKDYWESV